MSNINIGAVIDIAKVVKDALGSEAKKSTNDMKPSDAEKIAPPVAAKVEAAVNKEMNAIITNQTNQEPWYQSRVTWGAIIAVGASVAGLVGYEINAESQQELLSSVTGLITLGMGIATAVGGIVTWYGRWIAKKPIGE